MKKIIFLVLMLALVGTGCRHVLGALALLGAGAVGGAVVMHEMDRPPDIRVDPGQIPSNLEMYPGYPGYYYDPYSSYPLFWYGGHWYGYWGGYWYGRYGRGSWGRPYFMPRGMREFHRGYSPRGHGGGYR